MMKFCIKCGTFYKEDECPKCAEYEKLRAEAEAFEIDADMEEDAARRARKRSWLELLIGIPAFIGVIWIIIKLIGALKGA